MTSTFAGAGQLALAAAFIASAAHADTDGAAAHLDAVTVTATRGAALRSLDVSATAISGEQVRAAPETTLEQIVNKIPGVFSSQVPAAQLHPTGQEFGIRGFGTTTNVNTLVMVNGVPANDPYFRTVDWSQLPKATVDRIEVIRGGGEASLFGNMAMGGILNVITRAPGPGDNRLEASYGSFDARSLDAALGVQAASRLRLGVTADVATTDGYNQTPAQYRNPAMSATASQNTNFGLSAVYAPTAGSQVYVNVLDHRIHEAGLVWAINSNAWSADRVVAGGSAGLDDKTTLNAAGWYGWNRMTTTNSSNTAYTLSTPLVGANYVSQTESVTYDNYGGSVFVSSEWGAVRDIKAGVDFRSIASHDPLNLFAGTGPTGAIESRARHRLQGVFAQGDWQVPGLPLDITVGLREDFWQARKGGIVGAYKGSAFSTVLADQAYSRFDPRIGAKYHLTPDWDLRGAAYENFAAPGMNQMYRAFIGGVNYTSSNPNLKPQTNLGEEVGVDYRRGGFAVSATVFHNALSNFIDYATVQSGCAAANTYCGTGIAAIAGGSLRQYVNAGEAVLQGLEVLGRWEAARGLSLDAGVTRTDARLIRSNYAVASAGVIPDPVGQQIGQVPPWMATVGAQWAPLRRLALTLRVKAFPNFWNNTSHTQLNQGATIADVGGAYRVYEGVEVFALVQNVGGARYYDQGLGYTATNGSTVSGSTIPALGLPLSATIGARAAF